jgi:hypothetical protein
MTYVTGQPILFVGCGQVRFFSCPPSPPHGFSGLIGPRFLSQTYTDLRHLRVNHIVEALLKD